MIVNRLLLAVVQIFLLCIVQPLPASDCHVLSESPGTIDGLHVLESSGNSRFCLCSTTVQSMSFPTERSTRTQSLFEILARAAYFARMLGEVDGREQAEEKQTRSMA